MFRKFAQPFYTAYVILIFVATLFVVLPFYLILSIPASSGSRKATWRLTWLWAKVWLRLTGMWVKQHGRLPEGEKYIIIANHVSYLDPVLIYDVVPFFFRPLAKYEIAKIPLFGFVYAQIALLVDRNNAAKSAKSMLQMRTALTQECSIFIYPEGTFNETTDPMKSFYDGAFRLAIETQVPILPILFPDTKQRWHYSHWWKMWPGQNRAYILEPEPVEGLDLADVKGLRDRLRSIMSREMERIS